LLKARQGPAKDTAKETLIENSSEANRLDKRYILDAQLIGVGPFFTWEASAPPGGYFLNRNMIVFGEIIGGQ